MGWTGKVNFEVLIRECKKLQAMLLDKHISKSVVTHDGVELREPHAAQGEKNSYETTNFTERQKMMLEHLTKNGPVKVSDFFSRFSDISSKTIQRDLQDLVAKNILKKEGEKRWTVYTLNVQ